jgi:cystathionine gamma-synthase
VRDDRAIVAPVVMSSTYPFADTAELVAYMEGTRQSRPPEYGRYGNPTVTAAEAKLAALEHAEAAVLMSSGMAAITTTLFAILKAGAHAVFTEDVYRKTRVFARETLARFGVEVDVVAPNVAAIEAALRPNTRVIFTETPTNPYLRVVDLPAVAALAKSRRIKSIVDATFATPVNLQALRLGIDLVIHSTTKYLGGHNDILGGVVIGKRGMIDAIREQLGTLGAVADPFGAFLLSRGVKTLALRVERQNRSAMAIAELLEGHPAIAQVWYPMLPSHPDHALARRDLTGGGAVVSFECKGGLAAGTALLDALTIPKLAASLGGVETLIEQPALMSYFEMSPDERAAIGIREGLVRLSVGIEDTDDLRADLVAALGRL